MCGCVSRGCEKTRKDPWGEGRRGHAGSRTCSLSSPEVDAVLIATPTPTHLELVQRASARGKNIFCEKPFCRTSAECKKAIAAAKKAKVKLFVGHVLRYFPEYESLKAQVNAGKIGKPGWVKLYRGGMFPVGARKWFGDFAQSGGVTMDASIHDLDWLRYMFGDASRVFCQVLQRTEPVLMDYAQITVRMKSGVIATVTGTWAASVGIPCEGRNLREWGTALLRQ